MTLNYYYVLIGGYENKIPTRRQKTSEIIVDSDEIVIRVPYSKPHTEIESLIKEKISWILKKQKEIWDNEKKIEVSKPVYTKDSTLPYLGKNHKIEVKISGSQKENRKEGGKNSYIGFFCPSEKSKNFLRCCN